MDTFKQLINYWKSCKFIDSPPVIIVPEVKSITFGSNNWTGIFIPESNAETTQEFYEYIRDSLLTWSDIYGLLYADTKQINKIETYDFEKVELLDCQLKLACYKCPKYNCQYFIHLINDSLPILTIGICNEYKKTICYRRPKC